MRTIHRSLVLAAALLSLTACDKLLHRGSGADAAVATTADQPSLPQKALSFVVGGLFEGEVTMDTTQKGQPKKTMIYAVKGDKFRMDMPPTAAGDASYMLFDNGAKKLMMVSDAKKTAFVVDMARAKADADNASKADPPKVTRTGKMDTVAGYECEIWNIEQKTTKSEACMADGLAWFSPGGGASDSWLSDTSGRFPLRVIRFDTAGAEESRMEVTKVERKDEDAARFALPAGYQVMDPAAMMGGMVDAQKRLKDALKGLDAGAAAPVATAPAATAPAATAPVAAAAVDAGVKSGTVVTPFPTGTVTVRLPPGVTLPPGVKLPPGVVTAAPSK